MGVEIEVGNETHARKVEVGQHNLDFDTHVSLQAYSITQTQLLFSKTRIKMVDIIKQTWTIINDDELKVLDTETFKNWVTAI